MPSVWILGLAGVLYVPDATSLHEELARYASGTRVMYVAAHPDDEHTELLSYLASGRHAQVVYLSLTRGDGLKSTASVSTTDAVRPGAVW